MNNTELPFCFIKFGKKKHLESLLEKGELYFNSTKKFNKVKNTNSEQGDENEGAIWIENIEDLKIKVNHPTLGEFHFKTVNNEASKLTQFNHNYLTCSFYVITTKDFESTNTFKIDEKMLEFGDYALIINNPKLFLDNLLVSLESENISHTAKKVEYLDLTIERRIEMNPFIKKLEHKHQNEYRIILKNKTEPTFLQIKGMKENAKIVSSKYIVEAKWEAIRS